MDIDWEDDEKRPLTAARHEELFGKVTDLLSKILNEIRELRKDIEDLPREIQE